jgi:cytosine/adenosine deaminase-related metal-dependent hydrolase
MIILKNANYIDWQTAEILATNIRIDPKRSPSVEFTSQDTTEENEATTTVIDCTGRYVTKSFGNGHHHIYSALARGMPAPHKTPNNFYEILDYIWWKLDKALTLDIIRASALYSAMECARQGVTYIIDHHASPFSAIGALEIIAEAFEEVGVSHLLCMEISDRDGKEVTQQCFIESENYLKSKPGLVGLHASFTVSDNTLTKAVDLAQKYDSGIHIHVAEDLCDQDDSLDKYGIRVVERLEKFKVLELPKTILVHCLHLSEQERKLIRNASCWVAQNTESNLNNNVGYFNANGLNPNIMFGTDGMHSDMLRSAKAAYLTGQGFDTIDMGEAYRRFRNIHQYIDSNQFPGDGPDNLVVFDYPTPTILEKDNFLGHFIYGLESKHISHVISNGKLIVQNRKVLTVNEEEVLNFSQEMASQLWQRMGIIDPKS